MKMSKSREVKRIFSYRQLYNIQCFVPYSSIFTDVRNWSLYSVKWDSPPRRNRPRGVTWYQHWNKNADLVTLLYPTSCRCAPGARPPGLGADSQDLPVDRGDPARSHSPLTFCLLEISLSSKSSEVNCYFQEVKLPVPCLSREPGIPHCPGFCNQVLASFSEFRPFHRSLMAFQGSHSQL